MSRPVSPFDQGHVANSAYEHQPNPSGPCIPAQDGSSLSEERHVTEIKEKSSSRWQTFASNAAETYLRTSEHMAAAIYKLKTYLQKNEIVRRTYWTAVVLGVITTIYYISGLFFQDRGISIAVRGTMIAEQSKNTTEGIAVAGLIINCHNMRLAGLDPGPDCTKYKEAKLKAPIGIENYVIDGNYEHSAADTMPTSVALPANSFVKRDAPDIDEVLFWDHLLATVIDFTNSVASISKSVFKRFFPDTGEVSLWHETLYTVLCFIIMYKIASWQQHLVDRGLSLTSFIPAIFTIVAGSAAWSAQSVYPESSSLLVDMKAFLNFMSLVGIMAQISVAFMLQISNTCWDRSSAVRV